MKISINDFRGQVPRAAPQDLPPEYAQIALNPRLLSGDLESWAALGAGYDLPKGGDIRTIHLMDRKQDVAASDPWLHWNAAELGAGAVEVDAVRGPVPGDVTERTYYTGTDKPRVTHLLRAVDEASNGNPGTYQYPYNSLLLGVPAPATAPTVNQEFGSFEEGQILISNPGAENGITDWNITIGDLQSVDPAPTPLHPDGGSFVFSGGNADSTIAFQRFLATDELVSAGQNLKLQWYQAGTNTKFDEARMGLRFLDAGGSTLLEVYQDLVALGPIWNLRTLIQEVPAGAYEFDIIMEFSRNTGVDPQEAYIDLITLVNEGNSYSYVKEETPDGWTTGGGFSEDAAFGKPAGSWKMANGDEGSSFITSNDLGFKDSPRVEIDFDHYATRQGGDQHSGYRTIKFGMNDNGIGPCVRLQLPNSNGRYVSVQLGHSNGGGSITDAESVAVNIDPQTWLHFRIVAESVGENTYNVSVVVTDDAETELVNLTKDGMTFEGDLFQLRQRLEAEPGAVGVGYWDNLTIKSESEKVDPDSEITERKFTSYVYTYVNVLGEESAPSVPSRTVRYTNDGLVTNTVTMDAVPPSGYGLTAPEYLAGEMSNKRLYRAVTTDSGTVFALVAELDISVEEFTDGVSDSQLGELLPSAGWDLPPEDGHSMTAMPNGITAMASKNEFCPSVQNRPHAYPINFRLSTDYPIVGMGAIDTVSVVVTESNPYLVQGSTPEQLTMQKLELPQGCVSKRSIAPLKGWGIIYASPDGLVGISGSARPQIITEKFLTRREWQALKPESIHGVAHDDRYFGFYDTGAEQGGFIFDPMGPDGFGFIKLDFYAEEAFSDPLTDTLYLVINGDVVPWEGGAGKLAYTWRSKLFQAPHPVCFEAVQVDAADYASLNMEIFAGGVSIFDQPITNGDEFVLPAITPEDEWEIEFTGTSRVRSVELAETMDELV